MGGRRQKQERRKMKTISPQNSSRARETKTDFKSIRLTPLDESDIDAICVWQNTPNIRDLTMGSRFPVQKDAARDWLKSIREQNGKSRIVFAIKNKSTLVGVISLHGIDHFQRKALIGIYVGNAREQNGGVGSIATIILLDYAFNGLDLRRVSLEVLSINNNAIRLYEKLGFVREGVKREDYFLDGKCIDTHVYGILRDEFDNSLTVDTNRLIYSI